MSVHDDVARKRAHPRVINKDSVGTFQLQICKLRHDQNALLLSDWALKIELQETELQKIEMP